MEDILVKEFKAYIKNGDLEGLKEQWREFHEEIDFGREIAWDYVFQKVYLSACSKKQTKIIEWLEEKLDRKSVV